MVFGSAHGNCAGFWAVIFADADQWTQFPIVRSLGESKLCILGSVAVVVAEHSSKAVAALDVAAGTSDLFSGMDEVVF